MNGTGKSFQKTPRGIMNVYSRRVEIDPNENDYDFPLNMASDGDVPTEDLGSPAKSWLTK